VTRIDLRTQVWWTAADERALDLLVHEFIRVAFIHRNGCSVCSAGGSWCSSLLDAFEGLLEWREGRVLRSQAAWLRAREESAA
jgi:hypothetical protein